MGEVPSLGALGYGLLGLVLTRPVTMSERRFGEQQSAANPSHHGKGSVRYDRCVKDAAYVLAAIAVVVYVVARQRRGDRFVQRSLLFPLVLGIYGVFLVRGAVDRDAVSALSLGLLALSAAASIGFGIFRGRTMELFVQDGELWERASWRTILAGWGGLIVTRACLIGVAAALGATLAASPLWIPLLLAVTLAAQIMVERERARATGAVFATSRRARRRARRAG
jgi:hypothetical protein